MRTLADSLYDKLLDAFPPGGPYPPDAFGRAPMPEPVARYLEFLLGRHLEAEADRLGGASSDWVDDDHPEVREARDRLAAALWRHAHFPAAAWPDALRRAADRVTAYLVRPVPTLVDHVFEDETGTIPVEAVLRRMGAFDAYAYLSEVVGAYFEQKELDAVDRGRFGALLARIDRQMTEDYDAGAWVRLLDPLFDLAAAVQGRAAVSVAALRIFFSEKDAASLARHLARVEEEGRTELVDRTELQRLIEEAGGEAPASEAEPAAPPAPSERPPAETRTPETPPGHVPLWKKYQQQGPLEPSPPPPEPTSQPPAPGQPLWKRFRSSPEPEAEAGAEAGAAAGGGGVAALERAVLGERGRRNRDLFVNRLFSGSAEEYERTLRRLKKAPTWTDASQIIAQEVFRKHQVNIYSEPAVAFTDAVEAQYRKE